MFCEKANKCTKNREHIKNFQNHVEESSLVVNLALKMNNDSHYHLKKIKIMNPR